MLIRNTENYLERADERIAYADKVEAIRERNKLCWLVIKTNVAIISILCIVYAIYLQF